MGVLERKLGTQGKGPGLDKYIQLPDTTYVPVVQRPIAAGGSEPVPNPGQIG